MSRKHRLFRDSGIIVLVTIFLLEIFLRVIPGYGASIAKIVEIDDSFIYTVKPHAKKLHVVEQENKVFYNNFGFHDIDYADVTEPDYYHIGFIGDSYVEGREVKTENTFCAKLREAFAQKKAPVKIYNFGLANTGTGFQYMLWKGLVKDKVKLDKLYLCIFLGNDIENNSIYKSTYDNFEWVVDSTGKPVQPHKDFSWKRRIGYFLKEKSAIINSARIVIWNLQNSDQDIVQKKKVDTRRLNVNEEKEDSLVCVYTMKLIRDWQQELEAMNTEMALMIIKDQYPLVSKEQIQFQNSIREFAQNRSLELQEIDFVNPKKNHFLWGEKEDLGHFNETGHVNVAKIIYSKCEEDYKHSTVYNHEKK